MRVWSLVEDVVEDEGVYGGGARIGARALTRALPWAWTRVWARTWARARVRARVRASRVFIISPHLAKFSFFFLKFKWPLFGGAI